MVIESAEHREQLIARGAYIDAQDTEAYQRALTNKLGTMLLHDEPLGKIAQAQPDAAALAGPSAPERRHADPMQAVRALQMHGGKLLQRGRMTELQADRPTGTLSAPRFQAEAKRSRYLDLSVALATFAVLAILPFVSGSKALLDFVIRCSAYGLFTTSLNLLIGYTGMISFGHGMFFGIGAYSFGLIMQRVGVPIPVAFVATLAITAVIAAVIGAICVRLKEIYFAFVTLAFQMLIHSTILSWASFTGGDQGLRGGLPRPPFLGIDLSNQLHLYLASCALLVVALLAMRQIAQSPFGYTLRGF